MSKIMIIAISFFAGWKYHEYTTEIREYEESGATLVKSERIDQAEPEEVEKARESGYLKGFRVATEDRANVLKAYQKLFGEISPGAAQAMIKVQSGS